MAPPRILRIFFVTAWSLWYSRNQTIFEANIQTPDQVWNFARRFIQDYKEASNLFNCGKTTVGTKWRVPPLGLYKVNVMELHQMMASPPA